MNVLLVEDNVLLGDAVRDHIAADGHSVDWCLNLAEATQAAETGKYGVILLDLRLPDGNGLTLLKALRRQANSVPVIILTAHDQTSDQIEGLRSGADDFLVKPFGLSELSELMKAANHKH
ncbi:transcriptional regulator [Rhizobium altiplani]|uniref:Transcriptional regulator n=1 Tax=Rhizobium altiplani TaxID=1864509 RepID=A0A120FKL3_9HYPH|nr:response regulator [Rhizobium altiplani]KWV50779.1 transcriptional regulator [Rhizobium altiplani]